MAPRIARRKRQPVKNFLESHLDCAVYVLFILVSLFYISPLLHDIRNLGANDWDQHFLYNAAPRKTIIDYFQFPLWNPYYCGGNPLLANPQSGFMTPSFILILLFGEVVGLKIKILLYFFLGLSGMYLLSRRLSLSRGSSVLASFIFMLSSVFSLHIAIGHTVWLPMAFLPFALYFFIEGIRSRHRLILAALFLSLMFLEGGIHVFTYSIFFIGIYSIFCFIQTRDRSYVLNLGLLAMLILLFTAVKLLPMMGILHESSVYTVYYDERNSPEMIYNMLMSRDQALGSHLFEGQHWPWHEYGSYVGAIPLLLFIIGIFLLFRTSYPLIFASLISLLTLFGNSIPFSLWTLLDILPLRIERIASRFVLVFVFSLSLIAGMALDRIVRGFRYRTILRIAVILIVATDLMLVNRPAFNDVFTVAPPQITPSKSFFQADYDGTEYPNVLRNVGSADCYELVRLPLSAVSNNSRNYSGEYYLVNSTGKAILKQFSPNLIRLEISAAGDDLLVVNQNFESGWRIAGSASGKVENYRGLISARVDKDTREITLYYLPASFIIGLFITLASMILSGHIYLKNQYPA